MLFKICNTHFAVLSAKQHSFLKRDFETWSEQFFLASPRLISASFLFIINLIV